MTQVTPERKSVVVHLRIAVSESPFGQHAGGEAASVEYYTRHLTEAQNVLRKEYEIARILPYTGFEYKLTVMGIILYLTFDETGAAPL